jgi:hypothetical protein
MIILLPIALVTGGLMAWGVITSRKQRGIDRRYFAAFLGFNAALVAVTALALGMVVGAPHTHPSPAVSIFLFVTSMIWLISMLVTVLAGLISRGVQRIALVSCSVVLTLIFLFNAAGHFGD